MTTAQIPTTKAPVNPPLAQPRTAEPVVLIIADISGYTRYMTANAKTLSHSHTIITELVEVILHEIELPLETAKLEGDAVFLFCRRSSATHSWPNSRRMVGEKLLAFFRKFAAKVAELSESTTCSCNACTHIEKLRLKIIVHSGEAIFHRVANFLELAGVDVIAVHRLLKNSVEADQYLLLTEAAHRELEFPEAVSFFPSSESYDDIGKLRTFVHLPEGFGAPASLPVSSPIPDDRNAPAEPALLPAPPPADFSMCFARAWQLWRKLWFAPLARQTDSLRQQFHHLENSVSAPQRFAFALLTLLLTPLMLPVGTLFVLCHVSRPIGPQAIPQPHPPDCGCGHRHH